MHDAARPGRDAASPAEGCAALNDCEATGPADRLQEAGHVGGAVAVPVSVLCQLRRACLAKRRLTWMVVCGHCRFAGTPMKVSAQTAAATDFDFEDDLMDDEMSLVSACSHVRECVRVHTHTHTQNTSANPEP